MKDFYDKMVDAGWSRPGSICRKVYTTEYVCKGVGKELVK